jgi:hypothetical protein
MNTFATTNKFVTIDRAIARRSAPLKKHVVRISPLSYDTMHVHQIEGIITSTVLVMANLAMVIERYAVESLREEEYELMNDSEDESDMTGGGDHRRR